MSTPGIKKLSGGMSTGPSWSLVGTYLVLLVLVALLAGCSSNRPQGVPVSQLEVSTPPAPESVQDALRVARSFSDEGRLDMALVTLKKSLQEIGYQADLHIAAGHIFEQIGEANQAREEYEAVILNDSGNIRAMEALGTLHLRQGRLELAFHTLAQAAEIDRIRVRASSPVLVVDEFTPVEVYNGLGIIADGRGEHDKASEFFLLALQIKKSPLLYNNLGYSRFLAGNLGGSEWAYHQALGLEPLYKPAVRNLALLAAQRGNYDKAAKLLESVGTNHQSLRDLGGIARAKKDYARALKFFKMARETSDSVDPAIIKEIQDLENLTAGERALSIETRVVIARVLRVRDQNSTSGTVIAWLPKGTKVQVIERNGDWSLISAVRDPQGQVEGWVFASYLSAWAG